MDTSNWRHTQVGDSSMESSHWRAQLQADSRERMVNRIMDAMKSHSQVSGNKGLQELEKRAVSFEEKVYIAATSLSEYMRKICFKILTIETTSQNAIPQANTVNPSAFTCNYTVDTTVGNSSTEYDWRAQLQADSRQRIVNKIMDTLKRHLLFSGHEGLQELKKIAVRFEENIYTAATSQSDYLRKISLEMLTMETRSQNPMPDAMQSNSGANSVNPSDLGSQVMQQVNGQGQALPIPVPNNHPQQNQQLLSQTMHNSIVSSGMQGSSSLSSALPPGTGLPQSTISNVSNHNPTLPNIQNIQQNSVGNPMGPGVGVGVLSSNNFQNQRQIPGRQQPLAPQQQQQQQSQNSHYLYQQQQLQQIAKQKLQVQGNIAPSMQQIQQQQQQQQNLLQPSVMQPTMMQSVQSQPQSSQPLMNHQQLRQQQQRQQQVQVQVQPTQQQVQVHPTQSNPMGQKQQQPNATNMQ